MVFEQCQSCRNQTTYPNLATVSGFFVGAEKSDPASAEFGSVRNITFRDCVSSDHQGPLNVLGISLFTVGEARDGVAGNLINGLVDNCVVSGILSIAGNARGVSLSLSAAPATGPYGVTSNIAVTNCRISDIHGPGATSAGIMLQSTHQPVIRNNSVTDAPIGILLTGTNALNPNNRFQLAASFANATRVVNGVYSPIVIDLTSIPAGSPVQAFNNTTTGSSINVTVSSATVNLTSNIITSPVNLNTIVPGSGWHVGDTIRYNPGSVGAAIGGLTNNTDYFAVVYSPGFTENGVIQNNEVNQCPIAGYREIRTVQAGQPLTSAFSTSAWINNVAYNNGTPASHAQNYAIDVGGGLQPPLLTGQVSVPASYTPINPATYFGNLHNLSLIP